MARRLGHDDPVSGQRIISPLVDGAVKIKLDRADLRARKAARATGYFGVASTATSYVYV